MHVDMTSTCRHLATALVLLAIAPGVHARVLTLTTPQPFSLPNGIVGTLAPAAQVPDACGIFGGCPRDFLAFRVVLNPASAPLREVQATIPDRLTLDGIGYDPSTGVDPDGVGVVGVQDIGRWMWLNTPLMAGQSSSTLVAAYPAGDLPGSIGGAFTFIDTSDTATPGPSHLSFIESHCGDGSLDTAPGLFQESCDDGNAVDDDCCSANCELTPNGGPCSDHTACTTGETCTGGVCGGSTPVVCPTCEDCYPQAGCVALPRDPGLCKNPAVALRSRLQLKDKANDSGDQVVFKWLTGNATTLAGLGDPRASNGYALCVYDGMAHLLLGAKAPAGGTCSGRACWKPLGSLGFSYRDKQRTPEGIDRMTLKSGLAGYASAVVKGKGVDLPMPSLANLTLPLFVQLWADDGACWQAMFPAADVLRNDGTQFSGKGSALVP
jgi:cysteine-rich repeat protein